MILKFRALNALTGCFIRKLAHVTDCSKNKMKMQVSLINFIRIYSSAIQENLYKTVIKIY